jgi:hypothetical protein
MEVAMVEAEAGEGDGRTTRNCDTKAFHGIICNVMNENTSCSRPSALHHRSGIALLPAHLRPKPRNALSGVRSAVSFGFLGTGESLDSSVLGVLSRCWFTQTIIDQPAGHLDTYQL